MPARLLAAVIAALALLPAGSADADVTLTRIGGFNEPTYVTAPPGDTTRLLVVEKGGRVRLIKNGVLQSKPFLKVPHVRNEGEKGLLSIAFDPNYASNGLVYAYYNRDDLCKNRNNCDIEIGEFRRQSNPDRIDSSTRRKVLRISHRLHSNHNGGQLQFGPDGLLYLATGDGGGGGDPQGNGQDLDTLLGKLLRIDPHKSGKRAYTVPGSNPFVGQAGRDEIFAYGLRNPYRFSFDHDTGDFVLGDVGQNQREEIDFQEEGEGEGANYGWNECEGDRSFPDTGNPCDPPAAYAAPVLTYSHDDGNCSVTGGYVSRDSSVPELLGRYVYADFCKADLRSVTLPDADDDESVDEGGETLSSPSSFGEDAQCRLYVTSLDGPVLRIESDSPGAAGCSG
jgi:glucose/arabinose dehydrogenase